jgi:ABC-type Co2+ transport system permease subunit
LFWQLTPEPKKSFRKAEITNGDDILTEDGGKIFLTWLLHNVYAEQFKKDVVERILKEKKEEEEKDSRRPSVEDRGRCDIHFPDGVLPVWLWASGFIIAIGVGAILIRFVKKEDLARRLPLLGMMAAAMVLGASIEVVPIAYHVNLTVISGILLGPSLIFPCDVCCEHNLGLIRPRRDYGSSRINTLTLSLEGILGYFLFRFLWKVSKRIAPAIFLATFFALFCSTLSMIGVAAWGFPTTRS